MEPTEITTKDIDSLLEKMRTGEFDLKKKTCLKCQKDHFPNYGASVGECDECYFSIFPKEQVTEFYRSFFE